MGRHHCPPPILSPLLLLLFFAFQTLLAQQWTEQSTSGPLYPPNFNLASGRKVVASSTCGEVNGRPIREMYCTIAGASPYTPYNQYTYTMVDERKSRYREMRAEAGSFIQGGQNCDYCEANTSSAHPASNINDGSPNRWQSPPLSRGMAYSEVNITFELEQPFYVSYVWVQMANSPRPGTWILERSADSGQTWQPWQYFASSPAECSRLFGLASLRPIAEDDDVICTSEFSSIQPMDNGEIMINLIEGRPSKNNFGGSQKLQDFARATNVRMRLLRPKTMQGHLMDLHGTQDQMPDVTVTRRYYYGIKEIFMVGRCICNGHSAHCDTLDPNRRRHWICRCEHNTEGENCERCKPGFEQKQWRQSHEDDQFVCEPCNCHGHSQECRWEEELDRLGLSLDIHGRFSGGGRCLNCQHNTQGINCNQCRPGFFRSPSKIWTDPDVCQPCVCDPSKHSGSCAEETGQCECLPQFTGPNCDQCAAGYFHPPECRPCECNVNGTQGAQCLPDTPNGQCPCREGFAGQYCEKCDVGFTNLTAGCAPCKCDATGAMSGECHLESGQCPCKSSFGGLHCDKCAKGYFRQKETNECVYCDCDPSGTEDEVCDGETGQCLCKPGFAGRRCDRCDDRFYGYPTCRECQCHERGAKSLECDPLTGECPCYANFTGRTCDKCSAGYYRFPECLACGCSSAGSKGLTCDPEGQCYCRTNFEGKQCEKCKPNFFNWPVCEECNCHPAGVVPEFAGCDKVPPGELCTCRKNVHGRTCSQCKPNFWDLQAHHADGCIDCNCNMTGTLSLSNACDQLSGQCQCKRFVDGQKCDLCQEGFYNIRADSHVGCEPCNCDVGGAIGIGCNQLTGQCRCRPRIGGLKCEKPVQDHFFPTLWHNRYEAEDGRLPDGKNVRFAIDQAEFPDFSWRGFVVFSTIQDEIVLDVNIRKSAVYKLLAHYRNPTEVNVELEAKFVPIQTQNTDSEQSAKVQLEPSGPSPQNAFIQSKPDDRPFVLNPGRWQLHLKAQKRLFLDYLVLVPSEYYLGSQLTEQILEPCRANQTQNCVQLLYPPAPISTSVSAETELGKFEELEPGTETVQNILSHSPDAMLPGKIGLGALVHTDDQSKEIRISVSVHEDGIYLLLADYHSLETTALPVRLRVHQGEAGGQSEGVLLVNHCPYQFFCREVMSAGGRPAMLGLQKSPPDAQVIFSVQPGREFSIGAVSLVKEEQWNSDMLDQKALCVWKDGKCVAQQFPQPPKSIRTEAESGPNVNSSIAADKLPFPVVAEPAELRVMSLDSVQSTLDIEGVVDIPGPYVFVVHYFSPDNPPVLTDVLVQNERFADAMFHYCPSQSGCRTTVVDKKSGQRQFQLVDKYSLTFYANNSHQRGPIYIDYVLPVPVESYADAVLKPLPIGLADEFVEECAENFRNHPENVSEYCRQKIFSLTAEFNGAALPCECNPQGALDFACSQYGGQCPCKPNVIGRSCDRCAPGYYNFPDCIKCKCGQNHQCDERTGQCFCPRFVEGLACDRCVQYAYGYDPLIGCQLCGCSINGSMDGEQRCDPLNGQCLCKENVGGRRCEKCLSGYWAFPECRECDCHQSGTVDDVCDERSAKCMCKKNVLGPRCDQCRGGTFDLRKSDPDGCSECFCFRVTDRCRSSNWPIRALRVADNDWRVDDGNGTVRVDDNGAIVYEAAEGNPTQLVYFEVDLQPGVDYTRMYGLHLSFAISSFPSDDRPRPNVKADVRLIAAGGTTVLEHWASEQPRNASQRFNVVVTLFPEYWLQAQGEPANRAQLMLTLLRLQRIQVKASYYERPSRAVLEQFQLEMADSGAPSADEYGLMRPQASSVEQCECPPPYTGPSCQECAPGYYRLQAQSGQLLGSCVPCQCHGHSGSCDPQTGLCLDCQHNTQGEHCEECREGFYGNASTGSAAACLRCPCPHPIESNNFARGCAVSEFGILERCDCRDGYAGDRCEMCAPGFFGNPLMPNGRCEPCDCNTNNDLDNPGACHPQTGDCALCEGNTDGRHCEYCRQWFWGDAVRAKNCSQCDCDQCGSAQCDPASGRCQCHPLVEGLRCDRCADNAWGLDSCRGCQPCQCGLAASNSQCDLKSGQCACMPGAAGQFCDRCDHGFWNYSAQGCQKCDCEADLSLGTVCDVRTGQCHCQEGATGPRCDKCLPNYLRVPGYGCRLCDECVYALSQETDQMDRRVDHLRALLANVSSETLTGARLNRVQKQMGELEPALERVVAANSPEAEELGTNLGPKASRLKEAASAAALRGKRVAEQLEQLDQRLDASYGQLGQIRSNANELLEMTRLTVEKIGQLRRRFETQGPLEMSREELKEEAERKLELIRQLDVGQAEALEMAQERAANISGTVERLKALKGRTEELGQEIGEQRERLVKLGELKGAYEQELLTVRTGLADVKKSLDSHTLFSLRAMISGIEKDAGAMEKSNTEQRAQLEKVSRLLEEMASQRGEIGEKMGELAELRAQLGDRGGEGMRVVVRREVVVAEERAKLNEKVAMLETEANKVVGIFDAARLEAHRAVEAANVYKEVADSIKQARVHSQEAAKMTKEAGEGRKERKEAAKSAKAKSRELRERAIGREADQMQQAKGRAETVAQKADQLAPRVAQLSTDLAGIQRGKAEMPAELDVDAIRDKADQAAQQLAPLNESFAKMGEQLEDVDRRMAKLMESSGGMAAEAGTARDQIQQVDKAIPELQDEWTEAQQRIDQTAAIVKETRAKLALIKEKVLLARDKANRVKLGAHFERGSFLELPLPQPADDFTALTDIRFFFRTREQNGLLLYLGSDNAQLAGEFVGIEMAQGRPKLTLNLGGRTEGTAQLDSAVNDHQWRELVLQRRGKRAAFRVSKPGTDEPAEEKNIELSGPKSVLNLFDDSRHLFIGGLPATFQMPSALQQRQFVGDMDKLRANGELVGFWNSERAQAISGAEMRQLPDAERNAESGMTFNGKGYMQMDVGAWNPRKKTSIMLSFMTYAPDGLLFFVGKDRDQLVLEMVGGRLSLLFDLGSGPAKLLSNGENYNDGKWHLVEVDRMERAAKLKVDDTDKMEGESPGSLFEMSVSDSFFLGGLPASIETTRFTVHPFRGCIRNLKLDSEYVSLARPRATKGVQSSCVNREVRVGTLLSERSFAQFTGLNMGGQLELSFRFRPADYRAKGLVHLVSVMVNNDQEELLRVDIEEGTQLAIRPNGDDIGLIRVQFLSQHLAGGWHHLRVTRDAQTMRAFVDDVFEEERQSPIESVDLLNSNDVLLAFGRLEASPSFVGCLGDVLFGGQLMSLAQGSANELTLAGCTAGDAVPPTVEEEMAAERRGVGEGGKEGAEETATKPAPKTRPPPQSKVRPEGACALPLVPYGEREDSSGLRFGLAPSARLELTPAGPLIGPDMTFSIQLRATAANGVVMFATDERHNQFVVLYLQDGKPAFASKSAQGQLIIQSNRSLLDDEWHSIRVQREGPAAALYVNDQMDVQNRSVELDAADQLELQSPVFVGGLPPELVPFAARLLPGVKTEFGGCLREFSLNGQSPEVSKEVGTAQCSQYTEQGLFFGKDGGYVVLSRQFVVGISFSLELEIKPRTKNAVLVSVGVLEFLSLQLINGTVKFSVDNGAGVESVIYEPPAGTSICDGHWHLVKIYKKKKLLTLNVDGKSSLRVLDKKSASETSTKDPLYLGGVPRDVKLKGLDTQEPYVGCMRVLSLGKKNRRRSVPEELAQELELFGSVDRNSCPVN